MLHLYSSLLSFSHLRFAVGLLYNEQIISNVCYSMKAIGLPSVVAIGLPSVVAIGLPFVVVPGRAICLDDRSVWYIMSK